MQSSSMVVHIRGRTIPKCWLCIIHALNGQTAKIWFHKIDAELKIKTVLPWWIFLVSTVRYVFTGKTMQYLDLVKFNRLTGTSPPFADGPHVPVIKPDCKTTANQVRPRPQLLSSVADRCHNQTQSSQVLLLGSRPPLIKSVATTRRARGLTSPRWVPLETDLGCEQYPTDYPSLVYILAEQRRTCRSKCRSSG